ncbi:MAG TPA: fimbria/pilus outer membrane usher protein [Terracidiphilus sp.]|nr:fimbria/pilus outer membrane usher protein [Terracidiphilus sp.]
MSQRHDHRGIAARWLGCAEILFLLLTMMPRLAVAIEAANSVPNAAVPDPNADEILLLDVQVNGHSIGKIGEFALRHGTLYARPQELLDLGFSLPSTRTLKPGGLIALSDLPGIEWTLDIKNQQLLVTAVDAALLPKLLQLNGGGGLEGHRTIESGTGVTLNYDTVGTFGSGQTGGATGSMDLVAFSPWGILSSEWLAYAGATSSASGKNTAIRLDSAYTFADVNTLRRYTLGDFINDGLTWNRPVHMEGVQIRSDFSMRPDLITFPLPELTGSAAVPSTVDVLVNGNLVSSNQVEPGPFQIPQLPVISGAGTITMTMTNALGGQVTVAEPFYAGSELLASGLHTLAGQAGLVRRNWGSVSNDYGKIAATAMYRRGLTRKFTIEGSAEVTPGAFMAGVGGVAQIGTLGVVNFSVAPSIGSGQGGVQFSLGAQRIGRKFSLGASAIEADSSYRDVASMNGDGVPRKQLSGFTSLSLRRFGSLGAAYAEIDQDAPPTPVQLGTVLAEHSRVVSANYSLQIRRVSIYASEFKNYATVGASGSSGLQVGLTIPLGRRTSVNVSATSDGNGQVQAQQSAAMVGDWGYDAYVSAGNSSHEFAEGQYKSPVGLFTAGIDNGDGVTTLRLESQGALSFVDGAIFPSNTINDSFAIVDTGPIPHVHVFQENRDVGVTGSSGRLLVPDMRSFDLNHIAISATDIPSDVTIDDATVELRPQDRSGVVVKFPVKISHAALLRLVDEAGVPMSIGSAATLQATGVTVAVGYDGDAYVEDLSPHNELSVEGINGRRCTVAFDYKPVAGDIPSIGPLRCLVNKP